ncbi:hypothetical protein GIB67_025305 [Kingdonia uniflora]|uniref:TF-B3 domain-containing protein n=1 Tax=Kingdonia uniflora TaxID=39325 RepID=A0A7J7NB38_9MAGN|nr:hypothetical protein GIB67_025305 [Kingdonia uniflora]
MDILAQEHAKYDAATTLMHMSRQVLEPYDANNLRKIIRNTLYAKEPVVVVDELKKRRMLQLQKFSFENIRDYIGTDCAYVPRDLTNSDVLKQQSRLRIPTDFCKANIEPILRKDENPEDGISVTVYDSEGKEYLMKYKCWTSTGSCVLISGWKDFVNYHGLKEKDPFGLWVFRHAQTDNLCFAVTGQLDEETLIQIKKEGILM